MPFSFSFQNHAWLWYLASTESFWQQYPQIYQAWWSQDADRSYNFRLTSSQSSFQNRPLPFWFRITLWHWGKDWFFFWILHIWSDKWQNGIPPVSGKSLAFLAVLLLSKFGTTGFLEFCWLQIDESLRCLVKFLPKLTIRTQQKLCFLWACLTKLLSALQTDSASMQRKNRQIWKRK